MQCDDSCESHLALSLPPPPSLSFLASSQGIPGVEGVPGLDGLPGDIVSSTWPKYQGRIQSLGREGADDQP